MTWFIDGGAHRGESIRLARTLYGDPLSVLAIEPNAACWPELAAENALLFPGALSTSTGSAPLYRGTYEVSASLVREKTTGGISTENPIQVATTTLSAILRALPFGEQLVLKLDIEGAEYDVLEQALADKMLRWVSTLYVDFHADRIPAIGRERHNALVERLLSMGYALQKWLPIDGTVRECGQGWLL